MIDARYDIITWKEEPFIEVFKIETIDDSIFRNYQRYDFYQLLWFTKVKKKTSYFIDFSEYEIHDNDIVLLFPGQIDRLDPEGVEGYLFAIDNNTFYEINQHLTSEYLNGYFSNVFLSPDPETLSNMQNIIHLFLDEYTKKKRLPLLQIYLESFLFHIVSLFDDLNKNKDRSYSTLAHLMLLIDKHYTEQKEIYFYAEQLGLSPKSLSLLSKRGTAKTVKQLLQDRLILEIKKEIRLGEKSLKEIAFNLNFNDAAYFTRFFKSQTGLTPSQFKEMR